jgi:hypothetical protein
MKRMTLFLPESLTFRSLRKADPICSPCDDELIITSESDKTNAHIKFKQYEIEDVKNIWYRVLCVNDVGLSESAAQTSFLGKTGHIERMNVWTHLFAMALFLIYLLVRPFTQMGARDTLSSDLASLSYVGFAITFASSATYHVYSANEYWSSRTRLLDYTGIYLGFSVGVLCDLSTITLNLRDVPTQAVIDVWVGMMTLVIFFVVRRMNLTIAQTRMPYLANKCTLGFARSTNVDLEHSTLRAAGGIAMAFSWIQMIPGAYATLENDCAWMFSGSRFVGTGVLLVGMWLDNVVMYPDVWFENDEEPPTACVCRSSKPGPGGGWICTSHALWHVIALLSTVITTVGTEYVIAVSSVLSAI